jgi:hypothetical protein
MSRRPELPDVDTRERGGPDAEGNPTFLSSRLFFQLLVLDVPPGEAGAVAEARSALASAVTHEGIPAVIYADVSSPRGLGLLTFSEDPGLFVQSVRPLFDRPPLASLTVRPGWTMLGRTYAVGYEQDLAHWLLERPRDNVLAEDLAWAVWYPLRRKGPFNRLEARDQRRILGEHGTIGRAYGMKGLAHDVRLACQGLDGSDNDFVIGLLGKDLHPLSHVVQRMRSTEQTGEWMEQMGPFFVGRKVFAHRG